jgi:hypothetical protein
MRTASNEYADMRIGKHRFSGARCRHHTRQGGDMAIDQAKLDAFMGNFVHDLGAVMHAATIVVGDQLGLYKALAHKAHTAESLARETGTDARYLREWLSAQAASGYVQYDASTQQFSLTEEQAMALADETSPAFIPGAFQVAVAQFKAIPKIANAFKTGKGLGWHEHDTALFHGTERFFRPGYAANLVSNWIPALDGVEKSCARARASLMSAAVTALPASSWRRRIPKRKSSVLTITSRRSCARARPRRRPGWQTARGSRLRAPRPIPATTMISSPSSTACTTWETRSARRRTS